MAELTSFSPITLKEVGRVDIVDPSEIPKIIEECRAAQKEWSSFPKERKRDMLRKLRSVISDDAENIARTVYLETGKPRADALNTEVLASAAMTRECENWVMDFEYVRKIHQGSAKMLASFLKRTSYLEYRPLGTVAVIAPYNFPFSIPFTETVTAVAAGNGVILKPSSETPLSGHLIQSLFEKAGFPENLVRAVSGPGTGQALASADVDKIVFTGGTSTGKDIMRSAAEKLTPVTLELGGKDAMIVLDDADLERTVTGAVWGSFVNSGQVCVGIKRIYVHASVYDAFVDSYVSSVKKLIQGDGWDDPDVSVGPMINEREAERMADICKRIVDGGGRILTGGKKNPELGGCFFEPTVAVDLPHSSPIVGEEIFGPVVTIFRFTDDSEAVGMACSTEYALGGSVWTQDIARGRRIASMMDSGTINVNNTSYTFGLPATPWGGRKKSGFGVTHSIRGFEDMMFAYHIHVDDAKYRRDPWWMPYSKEKTELQSDILDSFYGSEKGKLSTARKVIGIIKKE